jgi:anti-sigma regulatory factor (Ser/Thr protein kinase)
VPTTLYHERLPATQEAVPRARKHVLDALADIGVDDADLRFDVALTVSEAVGNAVRHAYPPGGPMGDIEVTLEDAGDDLVVTVQDFGVGMGNHDGGPGLGLGLSIMRSQTARFDVTSDTTGTTLSLHFRLP